jgi:hypothetical protein
MKEAGLAAVFGTSDDLMEFCGAIFDEIGCWNGGNAYLTRNGLLKNECGAEDCTYYLRERQKASVIEAIWAKDDISWQYKTAISHVTFDVLEDGEVYCRGIVFALADVPEARSLGGAAAPHADADLDATHPTTPSSARSIL